MRMRVLAVRNADKNVLVLYITEGIWMEFSFDCRKKCIGDEISYIVHDVTHRRSILISYWHL